MLLHIMLFFACKSQYFAPCRFWLPRLVLDLLCCLGVGGAAGAHRACRGRWEWWENVCSQCECVSVYLCEWVSTVQPGFGAAGLLLGGICWWARCVFTCLSELQQILISPPSLLYLPVPSFSLFTKKRKEKSLHICYWFSFCLF